MREIEDSAKLMNESFPKYIIISLPKYIIKSLY